MFTSDWKNNNNLLFQLFLDDAKMKNFTSCYKELHFLKFFFKRLKKNDSMRYTEDFPYLSLCGKERNFVRCDDLPIVFTEVIKGGLISEGNLNLVPLPIKNAKSLPWAEKLNFPPIPLNNLSKFSAHGVIWHFLLAIGPKLKYLLRLNHL